jgi:hypothetical protein
MSPRPTPPPLPSKATDPDRPDRALDDFDWPPAADDLSVYEIGSAEEPWQRLQQASVEVFAHRHGQADAERVGGTLLRAVLVTAAAVLVGATSWRLYRTTTTSVGVEAGDHLAPAEAPAAAPEVAAARRPDVTIIATYPVDAPARAAEAPAAVEASPPAALPDTAEAAASANVSEVPHAPLLAENVPLATAAPIGTGALASTAVLPEPAPIAVAVAYSPDAGIRSLLQKYEDAYDHRDVRSAAVLWPSLDTRALTRAFAGLNRQDVSFDRCEIDAGAERGSAVCEGTVRYVPSVGRGVEKEARITWTFDVTRSGQDWRITRLSAR